MNRLINRETRCIHFKKLKENVSKIKYKFKYDLGIFMHKFKRDILKVNYKPYLTSFIKIHYHLTRFSVKTIFPRVNNL